MHYLNQLEPDTLIQHFMSHPPEGFQIENRVPGLPAFIARFDLLTTADDTLQKKLRRFPLFSYWQKLLQINTCFVGTTVSEYALWPNDVSTEVLATRIKQQLNNYPLLIVKDIPQNSPLLDVEANHFSDDLIDALESQGFICISGQALAWVPVDYASITDYLAKLPSAARRKNLRRKLKKNNDLEINVLKTGDECFSHPETVDEYYQLYLNVYHQSEIHFDLLSREFFAAILQDNKDHGMIFIYKHKHKMIGYNICYVVGDTLVDKYVGFDYPAAREHNLYFVSWFYNLDYALIHRLKCYIAGWTDPEIKAFLGAQFTLTRHAIYVRNPILRAILRRLSKHFEGDQLALDQLISTKEL